jgi:hypothetical protein
MLGNVGITGPFLPYDPIGTLEPFRFQQVYSASQFTSTLPDGGWIADFSIRGYSGPGIVADLPDIQINLSTTLRTPDQLSTNFNNNIGRDDTVVVQRGPLNGLSVTPGGFTATIYLDPAFFYDPAAGNLLMDVRNYEGIPLPPFWSITTSDAQDAAGDPISVVTGELATGMGVLSTIGLVTRFNVIPAPWLTISLTSTNIIIRWESSVDAFRLEKSAVLGPNALWNPAGGIVVTNGPSKEVLLPLDFQAGGEFFRLVLPPPQSAAYQQQGAAETLMITPER